MQDQPLEVLSRTVLLRPGVDLTMRLPARTAPTITDLGCGSGVLGPVLRARFPKARITGVDAGAAALQEAWKTGTYDALEEPIRSAVPEGSILFVREENTGGNMVAMFPASPVRVLTSFKLMAPVKDEGQKCFYVWSEDTVDGVPLSPVFDYAYDHPDTVLVDAPWHHPLRKTGYRRTVWGITPIDDPVLYHHYCIGEHG